MRYQRHIALKEIGKEGQEKLKQAKVLIVGAGGLGSPVALYLAAAGVGSITIIDNDSVDESNLQRQILFNESDLNQSKVQAAEKHLKKLNSTISIHTIDQCLNQGNAHALIKKPDLVIDGTDNFATRYLINDTCVQIQKPFIYASILKFQGYISTYMPGGPCYRCLFPHTPQRNVPDCTEAGVLGALCGILGSMQAMEAIKIITEAGESLKGRLLSVDALSMNIRNTTIKKDPQCLVCSPHADHEALINDYHHTTAVPEIDFTDLTQKTNAILLDVRTQEEYNSTHLPNALLIPLDELPKRHHELHKDQEHIVYCQSGMRSQKACQLLLKYGFKASNLKGGLLSTFR